MAVTIMPRDSGKKVRIVYLLLISFLLSSSITILYMLGLFDMLEFSTYNLLKIRAYRLSVTLTPNITRYAGLWR